MITLKLINANSPASKTLNGETFNSNKEFIEFCELYGNSIKLISNQEYARQRGYSDWAALLVAEESCDDDFIEAYKKANGLVLEINTPSETIYEAPSKLEITNHIYNNHALPESEIIEFHLERLGEIHGGYAKLV